MTLPSVRLAARQMGVTVRDIRYIAKRTSEGRYAASRLGFRWCYADKIPDKWPEQTPCEYKSSATPVRRSDGVEYSSMSEAARANNVSRTRISIAVQSESVTVNGYQWSKL